MVNIDLHGADLHHKCFTCASHAALGGVFFLKAVLHSNLLSHLAFPCCQACGMLQNLIRHLYVANCM